MLPASLSPRQQAGALSCSPLVRVQLRFRSAAHCRAERTVACACVPSSKNESSHLLPGTQAWPPRGKCIKTKEVRASDQVGIDDTELHRPCLGLPSSDLLLPCRGKASAPRAQACVPTAVPLGSLLRAQWRSRAKDR